jgi:hypothetical protein
MIPIPEDRIRRIHSRDALVAFLRDDLDWPAPPGVTPILKCWMELN